MSTKKLLLATLDTSFYFGMFLLWDLLNEKTPKLNTQFVIFVSISFIAFTFGSVGFEELTRGRNMAFRFAPVAFLALLFFIPLCLIMDGTPLHWRLTAVDSSHWLLFMPFLLAFASMYPIALYLNQKKIESTQPQIISDAN
jgi:hypothetical protein